MCELICNMTLFRFPWNWGNTECVGVDVDRNWDYHWGEMDSSSDPCADNYAGPHSFSEPETRAVSEFLTERKGQIKVIITTFCQMLNDEGKHPRGTDIFEKR